MQSIRTTGIFIFLIIGLVSLAPQRAFAQGCLLTKNMAPGIGALTGPYLQKGEWQVSSGITQFSTDQEYRGDTLRTDLAATNTQVKEGGVTLDVQGAYAITNQFNLTVDAPFVLQNYWSTPIAGTRYYQYSHGLADMVLGGRMWLFKCGIHTDQNISLGLGVRLPTGNSDYQVLYPNSLGQNFANRAVFAAIQPGSGAWGIPLSVTAFKQFRYFTLFGSGLYLFSLRAQNDTPSLGAAINPLGPNAAAAGTRYISTPDSYLFHAGLATPVPRLKGLSAFVSGKIAGVPVHNVFGSTIGFRQPGYYVTVEPGLSFDTKLASYNISVPLRVYQTTFANFLGSPANADFARHMLVVGVTFNPGGRKKEEADLGAAAPQTTK